MDVIGDVHGCREELDGLLGRLGYRTGPDEVASHPSGRRLVFLGDLVDRGPDSPGVLRLVMATVWSGGAYCVPGNHDAKLLRHLRGHHVRITHGLATTIEQLEGAGEEFREAVAEFLESLASHLVLDGGRLVVAHAGLREELHGHRTKAAHSLCLYGEATGLIDPDGYPVRRDWAADYAGNALVVYGHTPHLRPRWLNRTVNIDTGCVFGGALTALRYPELETVSMPARASHVIPARALMEP